MLLTARCCTASSNFNDGPGWSHSARGFRVSFHLSARIHVRLLIHSVRQFPRALSIAGSVIDASLMSMIDGDLCFQQAQVESFFLCARACG